MAKRFIDKIIAPQAWRKLSCKIKVSWFFLWQNCDAAGVWEMDLDLFNFENGFEFKQEELLKSLKEHIEIFEGKVLLKDFIFVNQCDFLKLNTGYNPHKPVFRAVQKHNLKLNPSLNQASFNLNLSLNQASSKLVVGVGVEEEVIVEDSFLVKSEKPFLKKPNLDEFLEYGQEITKEAFVSLRPAIELKYQSWKANDWHTGGKKPRKIKNWKTTLANTIPYLKPTDEKEVPKSLIEKMRREHGLG